MLTLPRMLRFEAMHCVISIRRAGDRAVVVEISGSDVGELGDRPLEALDELLDEIDRAELFIDARHARGPSVDVSAKWAHWLRTRQERLSRVNMLTRSQFVRLTADFVRRFSELGERMRLYADPAAFDAELALATR